MAVAALATPNLHAQDEGVRFGIKLAPNMSWLKSDTKGLENDGSKIGYTFGLATEFPIGADGNYRFATGLFLNAVGGKYFQAFTFTENNQQLTKDLSSDISLQYVQIPLTMKLMTKEIGYMRYYGQLGFDASFNVRAKANFDDVVIDPTTQAITFVKPNPGSTQGQCFLKRSEPNPVAHLCCISGTRSSNEQKIIRNIGR